MAVPWHYRWLCPILAAAENASWVWSKCGGPRGTNDPIGGRVLPRQPEITLSSQGCILAMWVCSFSERTDLWYHLLVLNWAGKNFSPVTLSPAINLLPVLMSPAIIFLGVVVTNVNCSLCLSDHWKFVTRINRKCRWRQWTVYRWCLWHLINVHLRISPQIFKNIWNSPNGILYSGAEGTLIHEKWS